MHRKALLVFVSLAAVIACSGMMSATVQAEPSGATQAHSLQPHAAESLVWIEQKLTEQNGAAADEFGYVTAISGDTAVVGAPAVTVGTNAQQGVAYVFTKTDGAWTQSAQLVASDGIAGDEFGMSVAISGNTIVVGSPYTISGQGAAYVFTEADGAWTQVAKLTGSDGAGGDNFGWAVGISGNTIVASAVAKHLLQGEAYVFERAEDGTWSETAALTASDGATFDSFGASVAISGDTILIGSNGVPGNGQYIGAVYVFSNSDTGWAQTAILTPNDSAVGDFFGYSVALDGTTAMVGAYYKNLGSGYNQGAAYIFNLTDGNWTQTQELTLDGGVPGDRFGMAVALSGDTAFVSAPYVQVGDTASQGAVYVYKNSGGTWVQSQMITASDGVSKDYFGNQIAADGDTVAVGALDAVIDGNAGEGASYFYSRGNLSLSLDAPATVAPTQSFTNQTIVANNDDTLSPPVVVTMTVPAAVSFVSATVTPQGSCSEDAGTLTCDFGQIAGNAGKVTALVNFKAPAKVGTQIDNRATVAKSTPLLTASAATVVDNAPAASDGSIAADENKAASGKLQATDADGDTLTFSIVKQPAHGQVKIDDAATGAYTYTPAKDYFGADQFTFKANDGYADSNVATVKVTVQSSNVAPKASDVSVSTEQGEAVNGTLAATDSDKGQTLTFSIVTQPGHGTVELTDAHAGTFTYTPDSGFSGNDSFTFKANDGQADSNVATVKVAVQAPSDDTTPPGGTNDNGSGGGGAVGFFGLALLGLAVPLVFIRRRELKRG
ncbi:MAG TPA: Ig-like domain-containing protein [Gammaproteobacteria bacterium]|nr:Ig-like domain-containing protein [Gammaproteobacteria bacterium]